MPSLDCGPRFELAFIGDGKIDLVMESVVHILLLKGVPIMTAECKPVNAEGMPI